MVLPFPRVAGDDGPAAEPRMPETVLLIGNPNVGKGLLFKNLTHRYVNVSNFPQDDRRDHPRHGTAALFLLDRPRPRVYRPTRRAAGHRLAGATKRDVERLSDRFLRRDFGAVYLLDAATGPHPLLTPHQIFVAMITITLFMPCIANS